MGLISIKRLVVGAFVAALGSAGCSEVGESPDVAGQAGSGGPDGAVDIGAGEIGSGGSENGIGGYGGGAGTGEFEVPLYLERSVHGLSATAWLRFTLHVEGGEWLEPPYTVIEGQAVHCFELGADADVGGLGFEREASGELEAAGIAALRFTSVGSGDIGGRAIPEVILERASGDISCLAPTFGDQVVAFDGSSKHCATEPGVDLDDPVSGFRFSHQRSDADNGSFCVANPGFVDDSYQ